jgi:hypothetical protein
LCPVSMLPSFIYRLGRSVGQAQAVTQGHDVTISGDDVPRHGANQWL